MGWGGSRGTKILPWKSFQMMLLNKTDKIQQKCDIAFVHLFEAQTELASWLIDWKSVDGMRFFIVQEVQVVAAPAKECFLQGQEIIVDYLFHVGVSDGSTLRLFFTCRLSLKKKKLRSSFVYLHVFLYMKLYVTWCIPVVNLQKMARVLIERLGLT